jgi:TRAP-type mannitol/chloroaromatic compound transport system permease large subunit
MKKPLIKIGLPYSLCILLLVAASETNGVLSAVLIVMGIVSLIVGARMYFHYRVRLGQKNRDSSGP